MAPCKRYSFEECAQIHGLDIENERADAELLCKSENDYMRSEIISSASVAIWVYSIANIYIQVAECSMMQKRSKIWGKAMPHEREGKRAIFHCAVVNTFLAFVLMLLTSVSVRLLTSPLDNRTNSIVIGISKVFAAIIFCMMSLNVPQWFGVYHSTKNTITSFSSAREITFNLAWNIWKQVVSVYFFFLYFSCADVQLSVLYGFLIGVLFGTLLLFIAIKARSRKYAEKKRTMAFLVVASFVAASWWQLADGIVYIGNVWSSEDNALNHRDALLYCLIWVGFLTLFHLAMCLWTKTKVEKGISTRFTSQVFRSDHIADMIYEVTGDSVALDEENIGGECDDDDKEVKGEVSMQEPVAAHEANEEEEEEEPKDKTAFKGGRSRGFCFRYVSPENAPSYWQLLKAKLAQTYPLCSVCCPKKEDNETTNSGQRIDFVRKGREITMSTAAFIGLKRVVWYVLSFVSLFATIVNIGASYEQCAARNRLIPAFEELYPPDYRNGTMCAWDAAGPNATIKTFASVQDVEDANYKVIHCGACGDCSNWNDIALQYTSRKYLAGITKVCARESIGTRFNLDDPDPEHPVVKCNADRVGFTLPCSISWAWDEVHTKNHAIFTFLQANIANAIADMEVTYQDVTLATIDEAISGPKFVPWVGATRRRMNIVSDISRPTNQQCTTVTQNWTEIFTEPFRPPIGGTYTIQPPGQPSETVTIQGRNSPE